MDKFRPFTVCNLKKSNLENSFIASYVYLQKHSADSAFYATIDLNNYLSIYTYTGSLLGFQLIDAIITDIHWTIDNKYIILCSLVSISVISVTELSNSKDPAFRTDKPNDASCVIFQSHNSLGKELHSIPLKSYAKSAYYNIEAYYNALADKTFFDPYSYSSNLSSDLDHLVATTPILHSVKLTVIEESAEFTDIYVCSIFMEIYKLRFSNGQFKILHSSVNEYADLSLLTKSERRAKLDHPIQLIFSFNKLHIFLHKKLLILNDDLTFYRSELTDSTRYFDAINFKGSLFILSNLGLTQYLDSESKSSINKSLSRAYKHINLNRALTAQFGIEKGRLCVYLLEGCQEPFTRGCTYRLNRIIFNIERLTLKQRFVNLQGFTPTSLSVASSDTRIVNIAFTDSSLFIFSIIHNSQINDYVPLFNYTSENVIYYEREDELDDKAGDGGGLDPNFGDPQPKIMDNVRIHAIAGRAGYIPLDPDDPDLQYANSFENYKMVDTSELSRIQQERTMVADPTIQSSPKAPQKRGRKANGAAGVSVSAPLPTFTLVQAPPYAADHIKNLIKALKNSISDHDMEFKFEETTDELLLKRSTIVQHLTVFDIMDILQLLATYTYKNKYLVYSLDRCKCPFTDYDFLDIEDDAEREFETRKVSFSILNSSKLTFIEKLRQLYAFYNEARQEEAAFWKDLQILLSLGSRCLKAGNKHAIDFFNLEFDEEMFLTQAFAAEEEFDIDEDADQIERISSIFFDGHPNCPEIISQHTYSLKEKLPAYLEENITFSL